MKGASQSVFCIISVAQWEEKEIEKTAFKPGSTADRCTELKLAFDLFAEKNQVSCGFLFRCNMNSKVDSRKTDK